MASVMNSVVWTAAPNRPFLIQWGDVICDHLKRVSDASSFAPDDDPEATLVDGGELCAYSMGVVVALMRSIDAIDEIRPDELRAWHDTFVADLEGVLTSEDHGSKDYPDAIEDDAAGTRELSEDKVDDIVEELLADVGRMSGDEDRFCGLAIACVAAKQLLDLMLVSGGATLCEVEQMLSEVVEREKPGATGTVSTRMH